MLRVKTKVRKSRIHGVGLFADQFIPKGAITWEYDSDFDIGYSERKIKKLSTFMKDYFFFYCYFDKKIKKFILCCDSQRFINHSKRYENILSETRIDIAKRNIKKGEEMFCDYNKFDPDYWKRHGINESKLN